MEKKKIPLIWVFIALYILAIYLTLPVMRPVLNYLYSSVGIETLSIIVSVILLFTSAALLFSFRKKGIKSFLLVLVPICVTLIFTYTLERPEERVHFLEYGVLGFFVFRAMGKEQKFKQIALSLVFVVLVGGIDEFIQLLLPNRVGEIKDVMMNAAGGALGLWIGRFWYLH
jgi:hypothetical protein